jgi:DNA-binding CsgD family transcriptional regulator
MIAPTLKDHEEAVAAFMATLDADQVAAVDKKHVVLSERQLLEIRRDRETAAFGNADDPFEDGEGVDGAGWDEDARQDFFSRLATADAAILVDRQQRRWAHPRIAAEDARMREYREGSLTPGEIDVQETRARGLSKSKGAAALDISEDSFNQLRARGLRKLKALRELKALRHPPLQDQNETEPHLAPRLVNEEGGTLRLAEGAGKTQVPRAAPPSPITPRKP